MKSCGEDISNRRVIEKMLISLPEKFDPIVTIIEETKDLFNLSVHELMGFLKYYEKRLVKRSEKSIENASNQSILLVNMTMRKDLLVMWE